MTHTILLWNGTTGELKTRLTEKELIGQVVSITSKDANGIPVKVTGRVEDVLETIEN